MRAFRILVISIAGSLLAGCGSGIEVAPVTGHVTLDGQPVTRGEITFFPAEGPPALGAIQADGVYAVSTAGAGEGAVPGHHLVTIMATEMTGIPPGRDEMHPAQQHKSVQAAKMVWLVPQKYSRPQTSGLTADVKAGQNTIDFKLSSHAR